MNEQKNDLEHRIIGYLLSSTNNHDTIFEVLSLDDFIELKNVFEIAMKMYDKGEEIDLITLTAKTGKENAVLLTECFSLITSDAHCLAHCKLLKAVSTKDRIKALALEVQTMDLPPEELISIIYSKMDDIVEGSSTSKVKSIKEVLSENVGKASFVNNNLFDSEVKFAKGDNIVIAGRPGMGKTALLLTLALESRVPFLFFSMEMTAVELCNRLISMISGIPLWRIREGKVENQEQLNSFIEQAMDIPIYIDEQPAQHITKIRAKAIQLRKRLGIEMIGIDYIQLGRAEGGNREQEISSFSRGCKQIAKDCNVPVISLSQLNRQVEQRADKRPKLSDLRESGAIEQDADIVIFPYRGEYYGEVTEGVDCNTEIIVAKYRNGKPGTTYLNFEDDTTRFRTTGTKGVYSESYKGADLPF